MADQTTPPKAPAITTPEEIIALYEYFGSARTDENKGGLWNPHNSSWTDPTRALRVVFDLGRTTVKRLAEGLGRLTRVESEQAKQRAQIDELLAFKRALEEQLAEANRALEEMQHAAATGVLGAPSTPRLPAPPDATETAAPARLPNAQPELADPTEAAAPSQVSPVTAPTAATPAAGVQPAQPLPDGGATVTSITSGARKAPPKSRKPGGAS